MSGEFEETCKRLGEAMKKPPREEPLHKDIERIGLVFARCQNIMAERQRQYGSQWKKYGWRGALYSARRKVERAWAQLWDKTPHQVKLLRDEPEITRTACDDLYDTINYCAMAIIAVEDGNRDGEGGWWS